MFVSIVLLVGGQKDSIAQIRSVWVSINENQKSLIRPSDILGMPEVFKLKKKSFYLKLLHRLSTTKAIRTYISHYFQCFESQNCTLKYFFYLNNAVACNLQQLGKYLTTVFFRKLFSSFDFIPGKDI